jgi:hypothetical protein
MCEGIASDFTPEVPGIVIVCTNAPFLTDESGASALATITAGVTAPPAIGAVAETVESSVVVDAECPKGICEHPATRKSSTDAAVSRTVDVSGKPDRRSTNLFRNNIGVPSI